VEDNEENLTGSKRTVTDELEIEVNDEESRKKRKE
jgi:hypothetical protein